MDPEHGLIRYGRGDQAFLISSQVFEIDNHGRSYRFRPKTRSVWLRQVTLVPVSKDPSQERRGPTDSLFRFGGLELQTYLTETEEVSTSA